MGRVDVFLVKQALLVDEMECGDTGFIKEYEGNCFVALVDVLGHGAEAHDVAVIAEDFLGRTYHENLVDIMNGLDETLRSTRGAVALLCRLDLDARILNYTGIGNIAGRIFGSTSTRLLSRDGVIGYHMPRPKEQTIALSRGDRLVLSSDGIQEHYDLNAYPELLLTDAETMATSILRLFGKKTDDASCMVLRYMK